jgi:xylulose-5-phosphate/fructose-6-phosphate phosphoketolase
MATRGPDLDRLHLVSNAIDRVPGLAATVPSVKQMLRDRLIEHKEYIAKHGGDMPEIRDWKWE